MTTTPEKIKAAKLQIEMAYSGEKFIGYCLGIEGTMEKLLVWADQSVLPGFRVGDRFVPGIDEIITYKPCGILCPEPEKPDHLRDATEKGGDRAAEMAEKSVTLQILKGGCPLIGLWCEEGGAVVNVAAPDGVGAGDVVDNMREWFACSLRAYGDELLDKAAAKVNEQAEDSIDAAYTILSFKSDATKGAT